MVCDRYMVKPMAQKGPKIDDVGMKSPRTLKRSGHRISLIRRAKLASSISFDVMAARHKAMSRVGATTLVRVEGIQC